MALYNKEKLVILFVLAALLLGSALWHLQPGSAAGRSRTQPGYVYELAGGAPAPGIYRFESPQTLVQLLAAAHAVAANCAQPGRAVANGSRIVVGNPVVIEPMRAQDRINCFLPIALDRATAEDLALIPGMGEKTALAIIAYRDRAGGIRNLAELQRIEGIGAKKLERYRPYLTVEN
jgi:competence protein ComEA